MTYTLTIVFNKDKTKVLMCYNKKQEAYNFIGGKIEEGETEMEASYRELCEETGISRDEIDLKFVRREAVTANVPTYRTNVWSMFVTTGIFKTVRELRQEKNPLYWLDLDEFNYRLNEMYGNGNCLVFLQEAMAVLIASEQSRVSPKNVRDFINEDPSLSHKMTYEEYLDTQNQPALSKEDGVEDAYESYKKYMDDVLDTENKTTNNTLEDFFEENSKENLLRSLHHRLYMLTGCANFGNINLATDSMCRDCNCNNPNQANRCKAFYNGLKSDSN